MAVDPRTLSKIGREADCHLIPERFGVSDVTVRLDADFDSRIGTTCDAELQRYFEVFLGDVLKGRIALGGGSRSLKAVHSVRAQIFIIPKPRGGTVHDFADRALGLGDGSPRFESFTGDTVDCARAFTSIIHSAFLVLYHEGEREVFERKFDAVRVLLKKAVDGMLTNADYEAIREMVQISIALPRERFGDKAVSVNDYRTLYDPSFDFGDGLLEDFPKKCISYGESQWVVTLPYSRSLRAKICFDR